jgi:hypothetical protein
MKGLNISKITEKGCNDLFSIYILFAIVSSVVLFLIALLVILITKN